jgi:hypothetical protein
MYRMSCNKTLKEPRPAPLENNSVVPLFQLCIFLSIAVSGYVEDVRTDSYFVISLNSSSVDNGPWHSGVLFYIIFCLCILLRWLYVVLTCTHACANCSWSCQDQISSECKHAKLLKVSLHNKKSPLPLVCTLRFCCLITIKRGRERRAVGASNLAYLLPIWQVYRDRGWERGAVGDALVNLSNTMTTNKATQPLGACASSIHP